MHEALSTDPNLLPIRQAVTADMPALVALLQEAQTWMDDRGLGQWVPGAHDSAIIEAMIERQTLYVYERDSRVIATCQLRDVLPAHWSISPEAVGYISTLTVARDFAGQGIGTDLLRWAEGELCRMGKAWACLDCFGKNSRLRAYYEAQGYSAIGDVETYPDYPERMYRKRLG